MSNRDAYDESSRRESTHSHRGCGRDEGHRFMEPDRDDDGRLVSEPDNLGPLKDDAALDDYHVRSTKPEGKKMTTNPATTTDDLRRWRRNVASGRRLKEESALIILDELIELRDLLLIN